MDTRRSNDKPDIKDMTNMNNGEWGVWAKHVLITIETLTKSQKNLDDKVDRNKDTYIAAINELKLGVTEQFGELKSELRVVKTKYERRALLISSLVGGVPAVAALIYFVLNLVN